MARENETKRVFGDNPISRLNTFEKLTALKQPERRDNSSRILTTPEAIVRDHRRVVRLRAKNETNDPKILGRQPKPLPWHQKINWNFVNGVIAIGCGVALIAVFLYMAIGVLIPFLRTLRWQ